MNFCPECGSKITKNAKFCGNCGKVVEMMKDPQERNQELSFVGFCKKCFKVFDGDNRD